jgi:tRNA 5-methylaminomethyl-2-thiouridine biosynthesis bifunctional protein
MSKYKGFGRKREMLIGEMTQPQPDAARAPWFARTGTEAREVAIIGGGIASALLSLALLRRGWAVTLYCADTAPAQGASGNRQGALYPLLTGHDVALAQFFPAAFLFARRLYDALPVEFDHEWCGVTQLGWDEKSAQKIIQMLSLGLPEDIARAVSDTQMHGAIGLETGCGGIEYPLGGWLCPADLTTAVFEQARQQGLQVHWGKPLTALEQQETGWQLQFEDGQTALAPAVVLASGHNINQFTQTEHLPVYAVGGQVSHIPTTENLAKLKQVLCYDGYLTPQNPRHQQHCIGASYHRGEREMTFNEEDQQANRQRLIDCFPDKEWTQEVDVSANEARCGVRCATRDHLPMVGNVPDYEATLRDYASLHESPHEAHSAPIYPNLFMLGGLGSRGLCSAPLTAEVLAAQMSNEPLPLDATTLAGLNPNRLWVRKLLKGKAVK